MYTLIKCSLPLLLVQIVTLMNAAPLGSPDIFGVSDISGSGSGNMVFTATFNVSSRNMSQIEEEELNTTTQEAVMTATTLSPHSPYNCSATSRNEQANSLASFNRGLSIMNDLEDKCMEVTS